MDNRLIINYDDLKEVIKESVESVHDFRTDAVVKQILNSKDIEEIKKFETAIDKRIDDKFSVVIMGDFKRGKSTLINSLLGKQVAPTNVTPETITINKISYAEEAKCEAVLENKMRLKLAADELCKEKIEEIIKDIPAPIDYIDVRENAEILKDITIIDTPGLGDFVNDNDQKVSEYLLNADAVIYVVSVLSPISETEQEFLNSSVLPQNFSNLFVAVNMCDTLSSVDEVERVRDEIIKRVSRFVSDPKVFAISALDEFNKSQGLDATNPSLSSYLQTEYDVFRKDLETNIIFNRDVIKFQRMTTLVNAMTKFIRNKLSGVIELSNIDRADLEETLAQLNKKNDELDNNVKASNKELTEYIVSLKDEAKVWMNEFLGRLEAEVRKLSTSEDGKTLQRHFQFFFTNAVKNATMACIKAHSSSIEDKIKDLTGDYGSVSVTDGKLNIGDVRINVKNTSWTAFDSGIYVFDMLNQMSGGILFGVSNIGRILAGFYRTHKVKISQSDYLKPVLDNFGSVTQSVNVCIDQTYDKIADLAGEIMGGRFKDRIDESISMISSAIERTENSALKAAEIKEKIMYANEMLDSIDKNIETYKI